MARTSTSRNVLVFGTSAVARAAARELERRSYTVIRFTETDAYGDIRRSLRTTSRASEIIAEAKPIRIVVCLCSPLEELPLRELLGQQIEGVPVETGHEAYERLTGKIFLDERTPLHLLSSHAGVRSRVYGATKRFVSAAVAAMALVVALPLMALITLSIYVMHGAPVLFVQERVGLHGRPFRLLKFRSMRVEKSTSSEWERDNTDRITPLGRWLRKLHLDELPQFWNILLGDMDLVGPRPHPVSNYELFARSIPYYSLRSLVRPGLTGWAQVRQGYAHDLTGEIEKMCYDLCAIARPSLLRDFWVLVATAKTVLVARSPLEREGIHAVGKADHGDRVALSYGSRRVFFLQALAKALSPHPDNSMVTASSENPGMVWVGWRRALRLVATVVFFLVVAEVLRLAAQTWINTPPTPTVAATAMALRPPGPTSPTIVAVTAASDLASLDAAEATARAAVERYETSNAPVLKSIRAKRVGAENFVDGRTQYDAEVRVEIPRAVGKPIRRSYFLTLEYVGSGEWEIERAMFATTY